MKKRLSILSALALALVIIIAVPFGVSAQGESGVRNYNILGDADGSGTVNIFDSSYIQKGLTGTRDYPDYSAMDKSDVRYLAADADRNGTINIFDAAGIQHFLVGSDTASPIGKPIATEVETEPTQPITEIPTEPATENMTPLSSESAKTIDGATLLISIFADDSVYQWTWDDQDREIRETMGEYVQTACTWLTAQSARYGKVSSFIYDLDPKSDLCYRAEFSGDLCSVMSISMYDYESSFVKEHVPVRSLLDRYNADNAIFMFFFNTPAGHPVNPYSISNTTAPGYDYESITLFVRFKSYLSTPSGIAHEILHCFGAYDLYYAKKVPQAYVDHLKQNNCMDIMYRTNAGPRIVEELSELDAYYIGLTDTCSDVAEWNLPTAPRLQQTD